MKKRAIRLLSMLLALLMLTGCSSSILNDPLDRAYRALQRSFISAGRNLVPFDEMEYLRPDMSTISADFDAVNDALESGDIDSVSAALDACYLDYYNFDTMYTLADIRSCQDVSDSYYADEVSWCGENFTAVQQKMEDMFYACAASDLAQELEENYFWDGFTDDYSDRSQSHYSDAVVELMQRESALVSEYRALAAESAAGLGDTSGVGSDMQTMQNYEKYNEDFARIYIELVRVRQELAAQFGMDYEQMQYSFYFERDYTPEQAAQYVADIRNYMVPVYEEVMEASPYDDIYYDYLDEDELIGVLRNVTELMGGDIKAAFDFMTKYKLCDVSVNSSKAAMSFQTYLENYEAPFLFLDPYGDTEDILTFSHEFGHYVDAFVNYNASETIDMSECYSQAMEYLALGYYDEVLGEDEADNLRRMKLLDTLDLYVQQASFAEFESTVYSMDPDQLSAEVLNDLSLQLARDYGYCDESRAKYYAMSWSDIAHFFEYPFYVITYPVSNDIAMQIYELSQDGGTAGLDKYNELLSREYTGFLDNIEEAGFVSPFESGRVQRVAEDMRLLMQEQRAA